jgi:hypothetical protein
MAIDLDREQLVPLTCAAQQYPGRRPHIATVFRHVLKGVRGVQLESTMIAGRRYTSMEAIRRFLSAINARSPLGNQPAFGDYDARVEAELERQGL